MEGCHIFSVTTDTVKGLQTKIYTVSYSLNGHKAWQTYMYGRHPEISYGHQYQTLFPD